MLALAARTMGYRIHIYSPESDPPAGQVADLEIVGEYDDDVGRIRGFVLPGRIRFTEERYAYANNKRGLHTSPPPAHVGLGVLGPAN